MSQISLHLSTHTDILAPWLLFLGRQGDGEENEEGGGGEGRERKRQQESRPPIELGSFPALILPVISCESVILALNKHINI